MTAFNLALMLSPAITGEVFILSNHALSIATAPEDLARYAGRAI